MNLGYFLLFVLLRKDLLVEGVECCNKQDVIQEHLQFDDNPNHVWNTEFFSENVDLQYQVKLFTIYQISEEIIVYLKQSQLGYKCIIAHEQEKEIFLQLGMFQQIFIQHDQYNIVFQWYQDFQLVYDKIFTFQKKQNLIIKNHEELLCWQLIQLQNMNSFLQNCENQFHINITMHPLLDQLEYNYFNNNFYCIEFWLKYIKDQNTQLLISIQQIDLNNVIKLDFKEYKTRIIFDHAHIDIEEENKEAWNYYKLSYSRNDQIFEYKSLNTFKLFESRQQFIKALQLFIIPSLEIIFTGIKIHLRQTNLQILCNPGCLKCEQQEQCLECDKRLELIKGFCECQKNFDFIISLSECYVEIDYELSPVESSLRRADCPTYGGIECHTCLNQIQAPDSLECLYETDIPFQQPEIELQQNIYYLFITYELVDDQYQYSFKQLFYGELHVNNVILFRESLNNYYLLGQNSNKEGICLKHYYFSHICLKMNKKCQIQQIRDKCKLCQVSQFLQNGQCKKCPIKCVSCQLIKNQLICLKCNQMYFLNFQRKCIFCQLQNCQSCYHFQGQLNTLERDFHIQKRNFSYNVGCSYCEDEATLDLSNRICTTQLNTFVFKMMFKGKSYATSDREIVFLISQIHNCQYNCLICNNQCFVCDRNYYLNIELNECIPQRDNFDIFNQNMHFHDYDSIFSLLTFMIYAYDYSSISNKQNQYYIPYCKTIYIRQLTELHTAVCQNYKYLLIKRNNVNFIVMDVLKIRIAFSINTIQKLLLILHLLEIFYQMITIFIQNFVKIHQKVKSVNKLILTLIN